jgi:hypothetical protein
LLQHGAATASADQLAPPFELAFITTSVLHLSLLVVAAAGNRLLLLLPLIQTPGTGNAAAGQHPSPYQRRPSAKATSRPPTVTTEGMRMQG